MFPPLVSICVANYKQDHFLPEARASIDMQNYENIETVVYDDLEGVGSGEAFIAITASADRIVAALRTLADSCPRTGSTGRRRHLEVLALNFGELGELAHDARRVTLQLVREEQGE